MPYGKEGSCSQSEEGLDWLRNAQVSYHERKFNMDLNTLMLIVGQNRLFMEPKRVPNLPLGLCYNCLENHLIKNCLYPRQPRKTNVAPIVLALAGYCLECGIKKGKGFGLSL